MVMVNRLADRMLALFMPRGEAFADFCDRPSCGCFYQHCYCVGSKAYTKLCDGGCNGIPVYCSSTGCQFRNFYCA